MARQSLKLLITYFFILAVLLFTNGCKYSAKDRLQNEINTISKKWVPDNRLAVCKAVLIPSGKSYILKGESTLPGAKDEIIKTLGSEHTQLIDSLVSLPDTSLNKNCFGLVSLSVINLRKAPDHSSELVSQAIMGTPVLILKREESWLLVQTPDAYISWTESYSIRSMNVHKLNEWRKGARLIYLESTGWVYDTITGRRGVVSDLVGGSIMEKSGETGDWFSVVLPDGRKGFVEKSKVMDFDSWRNSVQCTEESVCNTADRFMGIPYLWGGTSYKGVDCSGFVKTVFFLNGFILQRDASLQALHGSDVDVSTGFDNLKKGDLLFFGSKTGEGKPHVTHVAIYIGNKDYINASGRVMINSFDSTRLGYVSFRYNSLLSAKRIIGTTGDPGIVAVIKHEWY